MNRIPRVGDTIYCVHPQFNYRVQKNVIIEVIQEADDIILITLSNGFMYGSGQIGLCLFLSKAEAIAKQEKIFANLKK